ncbi:MAG: 3-keto-5-aminohexanoate cleavage protein [Minwuiales bacterium]|nr:3-keto-5-aminohexanoate cleavage protein [Minwuiales bacterium]
MANPIWLEAALNGPWSRAIQPKIPISVAEIVEEGIACAKAGAAILHLHAYDEATGRQRDDAAIYAAIIEGIRAEVDAIVYPTIPLAGSPDSPDLGDGAARFAAIDELAESGLIEWAVVDPGSVNFAHLDNIERDKQGFPYLNPESHIRAGLAVAEKHRIHPTYAIYEPGFARTGAALAKRYPAVPVPIYRLMFSDRFTFSFPAERYALDAYRTLLQAEAPGAPWMIAGLTVDVRPLIEETVAGGGHVRVGLEDAPFGSEMSNVEWVEDAARRIENAGGRIANANDVRTALDNTKLENQ